jgi:hypothetical protein
MKILNKLFPTSLEQLPNTIDFKKLADNVAEAHDDGSIITNKDIEFFNSIEPQLQAGYKKTIGILPYLFQEKTVKCILLTRNEWDLVGLKYSQTAQIDDPSSFKGKSGPVIPFPAVFEKIVEQAAALQSDNEEMRNLIKNVLLINQVLNDLAKLLSLLPPPKNGKSCCLHN